MAQKLKKFPQIYRILTASVSLVILAVLVLNISSWRRDFLAEQQVREQERNELHIQRQMWEKIASKYPDYRDAYYQLAVIEYRLGNRASAGEHLKKVLELDPNFKPARELEKLLGGL